MDQSDAGSAGIFSRWTNRTLEARVYSHARVEPDSDRSKVRALLDVRRVTTSPHASYMSKPDRELLCFLFETGDGLMHTVGPYTP
eukprot:8618420-Pyramimonas_sp.AAC.1